MLQNWDVAFQFGKYKQCSRHEPQLSELYVFWKEAHRGNWSVFGRRYLFQNELLRNFSDFVFEWTHVQLLCRGSQRGWTSIRVTAMCGQICTSRTEGRKAPMTSRLAFRF